jgi:hypothetical protein
LSGALSPQPTFLSSWTLLYLLMAILIRPDEKEPETAPQGRLPHQGAKFSRCQCIPI